MAIWFYRKRNSNKPLITTGSTIFPDLDTEEAVNNLNDEGIACGIDLPEEQADKIIEYCQIQVTPQQYNPHRSCEAVRRVAHDPKIVEVARKYFGVEPVLYRTQLYWSYKDEVTDGGQDGFSRTSHFHYDVGDFKSLNVFIYLTDVDIDCGPHVVIPGTHKGKSLPQIFNRYLTDSEALHRYGHTIRVVTGKKGSGFFEDLTCYHKRADGEKPRLMLSILFLLRRRPSPEA